MFTLVGVVDSDRPESAFASRACSRRCRAVPGWCPPALEAIVRACLAKDVGDRPRDARALADALRAIDIPASAPTSQVQVIMPGRGDQRPVVAASEPAIAQTIVATPRG